MKKVLAILLAMAMLFSFAACGGEEASTPSAPADDSAASGDAAPAEEEKPADGSITLTVMMPLGQWTDNFDVLIEKYMATHPEIKAIDATFPSSDVYNDLLKAGLASGELPDIMGSSYGAGMAEWWPYWADLSTDCEDYGLLTEDQVAIGQCDDYGMLIMPIYVEGTGILYNMRLLGEAGWDRVPETRDELAQLCEDLQAKCIQPFLHQWAETYLNLFNWVGPTWLGNKEGAGMDFLDKLLAGEDMDLVNDPDLNDQLDYYDLAIKYAQPNAIATDKWTARNAFFLEEGAMLTGEGSWEYPNIMDVNPKLMDYIKQSYLPISNDKEKNHMQLQTIAASVNKDSKNLKAAKEFLSYIVSSEDARVWHQEQMGSPTSITSLEISDKLPCIAQDVVQMMKDGKGSESMYEFMPSILGVDMEELWSLYVGQQISREDFCKRYQEIFTNYANGYYD